MLNVNIFCVNMMHENTYVVNDETGECVIIDCGCHEQAEKDALADYIGSQNLKPVRLLCTHFHLDHVFGNQFVLDQYGLKAEINAGDRLLAEMRHFQAVAFGIDDASAQIPDPLQTLNDGDKIGFGDSELTVITTPGHSPGGVSFYSAKDGVVFTGDTLFKGTYGAVNLPGGRLSKLAKSITEKLFNLPEDTLVYPGHGMETTIGAEKDTNPIWLAKGAK